MAGTIAPSAETVHTSFKQLSEEHKRDCLFEIMEDSGHLLLTMDDGESLPMSDMAEVIERTVLQHFADANEFYGVFAQISQQQEQVHQVQLFKAMLTTVSEETRFHILFEVLDYSQRKAMITNSFLATEEKGKGPLIADLMQQTTKDQAHIILSSAIEALEAQSTTTKSDFLLAWVGSLPNSVQSNLLADHIRSTNIPLVMQAVDAGLKRWPNEQISELVLAQLVCMQPKSEVANTARSLLDRLKPNDRRAVLSAIIDHTANKELPMLLTSVLPRQAFLNSLGAAARLADSDFQKVLCQLVQEMGDSAGGKYVATLFRALPPSPKDARNAFLRDLTGFNDSLASDQVNLLLDHFSQQHPALLRKWMSGNLCARVRFRTRPPDENQVF